MECIKFTYFQVLFSNSDRFLETINYSSGNFLMGYYIAYSMGYLIIIYMYLQYAPLPNGGLLLPTRYPFSIDSVFLKLLIITNQIIIYYCTIILFISDITVILLIDSCVICLETLNDQFERYFDKKSKQFIQKHQDILKYISFFVLELKLI